MNSSAYPRIIAHRCGGALAPENSLTGLAIAARLGCRGVEFDVMLSKDGVPLLIHDETLERTTTGSGCVSDLSAAQIRAFDTGRKHHKAFAVLSAPTFDEALAHCAALKLWANIEIKPATGHDEATGLAVAKRLMDNWDGNGIVSSFSLISLQAFRRFAPQLPMALLYERLPENWATTAKELNASAIHLAADHVNADVAAALSQRTWACYTVNQRAAAERLFALGCRAVFTDRPDLWAASEM
jgi:glycerophosphoryl diester phosphodiesterase